MSDYIDRLAAIVAVNGVLVNHIPSLLPRYEDMPLECARAIMEIPSEERWVPCSERLPEATRKSYWVCTDAGGQHECRWTNANPIWTNLTTEWHWNIFDLPQYTKVVAWMPLPEPYEEEEGAKHED